MLNFNGRTLLNGNARHSELCFVDLKKWIKIASILRRTAMETSLVTDAAVTCLMGGSGSTVLLFVLHAFRKKGCTCVLAEILGSLHMRSRPTVWEPFWNQSAAVVRSGKYAHSKTAFCFRFICWFSVFCVLRATCKQFYTSHGVWGMAQHQAQATKNGTTFWHFCDSIHHLTNHGHAVMTVISGSNLWDATVQNISSYRQ